MNFCHISIDSLEEKIRESSGGSSYLRAAVGLYCKRLVTKATLPLLFLSRFDNLDELWAWGVMTRCHQSPSNSLSLSSEQTHIAHFVNDACVMYMSIRLAGTVSTIHLTCTS
jgi:hypothetical protein